MNSIVTATLDVVDYIVNDELEKLAELIEPLSEMAKKAYIPSLEEAGEMPAKSFGIVLWHPTLGSFNKYAMHEPGITEINLQLLATHLDSLPEEVIKVASTNLTCAARKFGIKIPEQLEKSASSRFIKNVLDIRKINEINFIEKSAKISEEMFALPNDRKYPINNKEEIIKAAEYFEKHGNVFDYITRKEFAENLIKTAEAKKVSLSKFLGIEKYAILDSEKFNHDFKYHIGSRISFLKESQAELKTLYTELLGRALTIGVEKTAAVLSILDNKAGISIMYGKGLEDPIIATYGIQKDAAVITDGTTVTLGKLRSISDEDLTSIIGNDAIHELKGDEGLAVYESLPKPVKNEVLKLV